MNIGNWHIQNCLRPIGVFVVVLVAALFSNSLPSRAQMNKTRQIGDTIKANRFNLKAIDLARLKKYDSAITYFGKAAEGYQGAGAWDRFFYANHQIGYILNTRHRYAETYRHLDSIENNFTQYLSPLLRSYQQFYGVLAWSQLSLLNYERALYYFEIIDKGARLNPEVKPGQILFSKYYQGVIYQRIGQYDQALKYMLMTGDIGRKYEDNTYQGLIYNNLGIIYRNLGEYERALEFYRQSINIEKQNKAEVSITPLYNNLGLIYYYLKDYEAALRELDYALEVLTNYTNAYYPVESALINSKALVLLELGDFTRARILLDQVLAREIANYGEAWAGSSPTLHTLGNLYTKTGDYATANDYYDQSIDITRAMLGSKTDKLAEMLNLKGQNYLQTNNYDAALATIQQSLISLVTDFNAINYQQNPGVNSIILDKVELIESLHLKAKVLLAMYKETQDVGVLQAAGAANRTATELADNVRQNMLYESAKLNLSKRAKSIYGQAIEIALLLERETGQTAIPDVFAAMENSKAYLLSEAVQRARALGYSNLPESVLIREDSIRTKIKILETSRANVLVRSGDTAALVKINNQLFAVKEEFEEYKQSNVGYNSAYQHDIPEISSFQQKLTTNELVVEYFAGENRLIAIAFNRARVKVYELGEHQQPVNEFVRSVQQVRRLTAQEYQAQAIEVYNILLRPILTDFGQAKTLVVIPDKQLGFIPWDGLVTETVNKPKYNALNYLVKEYTLTQHQTAALYIDQQHQREHPAGQFIGFAPDFNANDLLAGTDNQLRNQLLPLPFARKEVEVIANLLEGEKVTGSGASESYLKTRAASVKILHLATHAIIDELNPLYSKLILAAGDSAIDDDGQLHSFEIYGMKLNCALVTLSACNTGSGKYLDGEGIFSLGRSFLMAGAESVLTSLWEVSDLSTSQIMESFYVNIKNGMTSPEALRKAKLKYLKAADPLTANPHYWAGFVYIGQSENIYNQTRHYLWLTGLGLLITGLVVLAMKNRKRRV
jgi:CHAT domain-containing protein